MVSKSDATLAFQTLGVRNRFEVKSMNGLYLVKPMT